eukprot:Opistho-2@46394
MRKERPGGGDMTSPAALYMGTTDLTSMYRVFIQSPVRYPAAASMAAKYSIVMVARRSEGVFLTAHRTTGGADISAPNVTALLLVVGLIVGDSALCRKAYGHLNIPQYRGEYKVGCTKNRRNFPALLNFTWLGVALGGTKTNDRRDDHNEQHREHAKPQKGQSAGGHTGPDHNRLCLGHNFDHIRVLQADQRGFRRYVCPRRQKVRRRWRRARTVLVSPARTACC